MKLGSASISTDFEPCLSQCSFRSCICDELTTLISSCEVNFYMHVLDETSMYRNFAASSATNSLCTHAGELVVNLNASSLSVSDLTDFDQLPLDSLPLPHASIFLGSKQEDEEKPVDRIMNVQKTSEKPASKPTLFPSPVRNSDAFGSDKSNDAGPATEAGHPKLVIDPSEFDVPIPERNIHESTVTNTREGKLSADRPLQRDINTAVNKEKATQQAPQEGLIHSERAGPNMPSPFEEPVESPTGAARNTSKSGVENEHCSTNVSLKVRDGRVEKALTTRRRRRAERRAEARRVQAKDGPKPFIVNLRQEKQSQSQRASFRIRNRVAVTKCRQRAARRRAFLEEEVRQLEDENCKMRFLLSLLDVIPETPAP